jgi:HTH-type transcriptional regulator/antitoxin HipB
MSPNDDMTHCRRSATLLVVERRHRGIVVERRQTDGAPVNIRTPLDLGLIIRQQRRHLGLNQADLASRVGVGRQWIVAVEHGKARAELGLVLRTLAALDLTLTVDGRGDAAMRKESTVAPIDIDAVVDAAKRRRP